MDNIIETKSSDFAVRIVKPYKLLCEKNMSLYCRSNCSEAEQALVRMLRKRKRHKQSLISMQR